jgi:hypothetical protein
MSLDSLKFDQYMCEYELDTFRVDKISQDSIVIYLYPISSDDQALWNCTIQNLDHQMPVLIGYTFSGNDKHPKSYVAGTATISSIPSMFTDSAYHKRIHNPTLLAFLKRKDITASRGLKSLLLDEGVHAH